MSKRRFDEFIYHTKTDRMLLGFEIPTVMFQSLNAGFIILLQRSWYYIVN
jgi:dipeptide/tripeptide permease